jgi:hypothetical protein
MERVTRSPKDGFLWDVQGVVGVPISIIVTCLDARDWLSSVRLAIFISWIFKR